ncbi:MAG: hypothetical protein H5T98_10500 [Syntrophomonadaceae bacterium]|nr:hypothetical protein [Syntrophomonadaceae bacterium]
MVALRVIDVQRMTAILEAFSILDDIRWSDANNYNLINYCREDLTDDEKLLTHWLCYIMDRQMPFERIWAIGGYIISHLVHSYVSSPTRNVAEAIGPYIKRNGKTFYLEAPLEGPNPKLARYGITGHTVSFASRYMPEDLVLIYRTLGILDKVAGRSFARFICLALSEEMDLEQGIKRMALALNQLTYVAGGAVSGAKFDQRIREMDREIADFELEIEMGRTLWGRKRLWCTLRDYLKSPEFNPPFVSSLREAGYSNPDRWNKDSAELRAALRALELPGDVWNNAEVFRRGLFAPYVSNVRKTWDMPRTIREIYEFITRVGTTRFYPEQLDVSFDFVPRMCQLGMCDVCLFGGGIEETCHRKKDILCPVVLYSCGYRHRCDPSTCSLKEIPVRGFCKATRSAANP